MGGVVLGVIVVLADDLHVVSDQVHRSSTAHTKLADPRIQVSRPFASNSSKKAESSAIGHDCGVML